MVNQAKGIKGFVKGHLSTICFISTGFIANKNHCCQVKQVSRKVININLLRNDYVTLSFRRVGGLMSYKNHLVILWFVILRGRREGVRPNMHDVTLFTVFQF